MLAHFVAVTTYFMSLCRSKCQYFGLFTKYYLIVELIEENVELHEKRLLITFGKRRVRRSMFANFVAVVTYFMNMYRNNCLYFDLFKKF